MYLVQKHILRLYYRGPKRLFLVSVNLRQLMEAQQQQVARRGFSPIVPNLAMFNPDNIAKFTVPK